MNEAEQYSDEQLQSFVDDELNLGERTGIVESLRTNGELAARVCELLHLKDSVRLSYSEPPQPENPKSLWHSTGTNTRRRNWRMSAVAAVLCLSVGGWAGWIMNSTSSVPVLSELGASAVKSGVQMVVLHIRTTDHARLEQMLDKAEALLSHYEATPEKVQLEIIADAAGLGFLRTGTSEFADRIRQMALKYQNLSFMACSNTINRLTMQGVEVHVIPEAMIIDSGADRIFRHLKNGWTYIAA